MTDGSIIYVSESITSLLEHLPVSILWSFSYLRPILNVLKHEEEDLQSNVEQLLESEGEL